MRRAAPAAGASDALRSALLAWYDRNRRQLPWRDTEDPYLIWLSEVMLQQTQVATVIPYWERFRARFPDVGALAAAPLEDVLAAWRGLGYYSRARNLHRAAQGLVAEHGGALPRTAEALLKLPGFGRYTAGAVASIAFGEPAPIVDGNVARVLSRLFAVEGPPGDRAREQRLWQLAETLVRGERPGALNQALMEHGATVCRPERPLCLVCPVHRSCQALRQGRVDELPPARVRAAPKRLTLALAAWPRKGALLLARRAEKGLFGGLWELPAVEIEAAASPVEAVRALARSLAAPLTFKAAVAEVRRQLTHRDLRLRVLHVSGRKLPSRPPGVAELRWLRPAAISELGMSTAMKRALDAALAAGLLDPP